MQLIFSKCWLWKDGEHLGVSGINCKIVSGALIHVFGGKDWKLFILMIWSLIFLAILFECFRKKYNFSHPANYLGKKRSIFLYYI